MDPSEFIKVAEEADLIIPLSRWVLCEVCMQISHWQQKGMPAQPVAVNISAAHFNGGTLEEDVQKALREANIPAHLLELELTESLLLSNNEQCHKTLRWLKSRGIRTYLDDFGTGYSSIAYLDTYGFDCIKLDRSFLSALLTDTRRQRLYETVVQMAHRLDLKVVAEGIETLPQLMCLRSMGVDMGQGYLFSRPCPPEDVAQLSSLVHSLD